MVDLEVRVDELSKRVSHLERQLETDYMTEKFERRVSSLAPTDDADVDVRDGAYGHFARITSIDGDDVQHMINKLDQMDDYDYAVTETGNGLGMEVWTENFK